MRGKFFKSDLECAVTLDISINTVRRARKMLTDFGWIEIRPGFFDRQKRGVATTFFNVEFSETNKGEFLGPVKRHDFNYLLNLLRKKAISHKMILAYVYSSYFKAKYMEYENDFFVTKKEMETFSNIQGITKAVLELGNLQVFSDNTGFFIVEDLHYKLKFRKWQEIAGPDENEGSRQNAENYFNDIRNRVQAAKKRMSKELEPEEVLNIFKKHYQNKYGKVSPVSYPQEKQLYQLIKEVGATKTIKAIEAYFNAKQIPNKTGAKTRTLANFLAVYNLLS